MKARQTDGDAERGERRNASSGEVAREIGSAEILSVQRNRAPRVEGSGCCNSACPGEISNEGASVV